MECQGAARGASALCKAGLSVVDVHVKFAECVAPVGGVGGCRGVGDEDCLGGAVENKADDGGVQVHAVGDDFGEDAGIFKQRGGRSGALWCNGRKALNRWVPTLAPASRAARVWP